MDQYYSEAKTYMKEVWTVGFINELMALTVVFRFVYKVVSRKTYMNFVVVLTLGTSEQMKCSHVIFSTVYPFLSYLVQTVK